MTPHHRVVVALAGRRIDAPDAPERHFPLEHVDEVRKALRRHLSARGVEAVVSSSAAGADLLGLQVARELGIRRRIVLPFSPRRFRRTSVADRPGPWCELYDTLVAEAAASGDLIVLQTRGGRDEAYGKVNEAILDEAEALASPDGEVRSLIVWDGARGEGDDFTAAFADSARRRGVPVEVVPTMASESRDHR